MSSERIAVPAVLLALALLAACGEAKRPPAPETSERGRDSTLARSRLPGAAGVGAALRVSDSAAARAARLDSISQ